MRQSEMRSTAVTVERNGCPSKEQFKAFVAGDLAEHAYEELSNGLAIVYDLERDGRQILDHPEGVWGVAFNHDASLLATGCMDGNVRLWQVVSGELLHTFEGHRGWVTSVMFGTNLANNPEAVPDERSGDVDNPAKL